MDLLPPSSLLSLPQAFSWIRSGRLAIGSFPEGDATWHTLQAMGIASVISCCAASEAAWQPPTALKTLQLALPDHRNQIPLTPQLLDRAVNQAQALLQHQPALFIHCWAGIERAPLLAVALLCRSEGLEFFTALTQVRQSCPWARPLRRQLVVLESWLADAGSGRIS